MAKRKKKSKKRGVSVPSSVRKAKNVIKRHTALLQKEKKKQESILAKTNRELRELKSL